MKYSIGYQLPDEYDSVPAICRDFAGQVSDVYFAWAGEPSGRSPLCSPLEQEEVEQFQLQELKEIRETGATLTLLLNANCYGPEAMSRKLRDHVLSLVDRLKEQADIAHVTTTSPFLAEQIRERFGADIKLRASVNMRIGTVQAMGQLSGCFDGFYLQKEKNRDLAAIAELRRWCDDHGKTLHLLANSGCLAFCGFQTFHDNLVAHEGELQQQDNIPSGYPAPCWKYLRSLPEEEALALILQGSWIRPEEMPLYEPYFSELKLATRMHSRPRMLLAAYVRGRFRGNVMDLTEPSYSPLFRGTILDNTLFPADWGQAVTRCTHDCDRCGYCRKVAEQVKVRL